MSSPEWLEATTARASGGRADYPRGPRPRGGGADAPGGRLERPDVDVLARMARGHDRELIGRQVEFAAAAGPQQGDQPERLDRGAQVDHAVRVADAAEHSPSDVHLHDVAAVDRL